MSELVPDYYAIGQQLAFHTSCISGSSLSLASASSAHVQASPMTDINNSNIPLSIMQGMRCMTVSLYVYMQFKAPCADLAA